MLAEGCGPEKGFLMTTQRTVHTSNEAEGLRAEGRQELPTDRMFFMVITKTL